jgi:hypothetical protein
MLHSHISRFLILCALLISTQSLAARQWLDLYEQDQAIYGKEKEEKYPIQMFFFEREKWKEHSSFHIIWLVGGKNYPLYESSRFLPFFYSLNSKIDNRSYLLTPIYQGEIDGKAAGRALFWLVYWGHDGELDHSYSGIFPLYYHSHTGEKSRSLITPLFFYNTSVVDTVSGKSNKQSYFLSPVFSYEMVNENSFASLLWIFYWGAVRPVTRDIAPCFHYITTPVRTLRKKAHSSFPRFSCVI